MPQPKKYKSKLWMERRYIKDKMTEEEIAELCGAAQATIHRWLIKHGLKRNK